MLSPLYIAYEQTELNQVGAAEGGPVPVDGRPAQQTLHTAPAPEHGFAPPTGTPSTLESPERPGQ